MKKILDYFSDQKRTERLNRRTVKLLRQRRDRANRKRVKTTAHNVITED